MTTDNTATLSQSPAGWLFHYELVEKHRIIIRSSTLVRRSSSFRWSEVSKFDRPLSWEKLDDRLGTWSPVTDEKLAQELTNNLLTLRQEARNKKAASVARRHANGR
jgi:hypothetical protein